MQIPGPRNITIADGSREVEVIGQHCGCLGRPLSGCGIRKLASGDCLADSFKGGHQQLCIELESVRV
jgi:hypothetical protein